MAGSFLSDDLVYFFNTSDFAVTATLFGGSTIDVLFYENYLDQEVFDHEIETYAPYVRCKTSDVTSVVHGTILTINAINYKVAEIQKQDDGLETILILAKSEGVTHANTSYVTHNDDPEAFT